METKLNLKICVCVHKDPNNQFFINETSLQNKTKQTMEIAQKSR